MAEETIGQEFRLTNIDETRRNYIEHLLILASVTGYISISSLIGISIGIISSTVELKICAITAGTKNYKSTIEMKKKKHDKKVL